MQLLTHREASLLHEDEHVINSSLSGFITQKPSGLRRLAHTMYRNQWFRTTKFFKIKQSINQCMIFSTDSVIDLSMDCFLQMNVCGRQSCCVKGCFCPFFGLHQAKSDDVYSPVCSFKPGENLAIAQQWLILRTKTEWTKLHQRAVAMVCLSPDIGSNPFLVLVGKEKLLDFPVWKTGDCWLTLAGVGVSLFRRALSTKQ